VGIFALTAADLYGPHWFFRLHVLGECAVAPALIHLALVFPTNRLGERRLRVLSHVYAPFLIFAGLYQLALQTPRAYTVMHLVASGAQALGVMAIIATATYDVLTSNSALVRRRIGIVALGALTGGVVPVLVMLSSALLGGGVPVNAASLTGFMLPLGLGYAIVKRDLFEVDAMLCRAITYVIIGITMALLSTSVLLALYWLAPGREMMLRSPATVVPLSLALLFLVAPLRSRIQRRVEEILFPKEYDVELALSELSHLIASANRFEEVLAALLQVLTETLRPLRQAIFLHEDGSRFRLGAGSEECAREVTLPAEFVRRLERRGHVARYEWDDGSGRAVPAVWRTLDAEILVGIRSGTTCLAILVLGRKTSTRAYGVSDLGFMRTATAQVALALTKAVAFEQLKEEAEISAALLQVSREMTSTLDTPVILDRLCQVTAAVLGCDCSHTLLWEPEEAAFAPISGFGDTPDEWERIRLLRVPREVIAERLKRFENDDIVIGVNGCEGLQDPLPAALGYSAADSIALALRRGQHLVGILTAGYRNQPAAFTRRTERIARGIAQTASMALANARLIEELEGANRLKSDFLASISHELRTPLNHIIGYNDLLLEGDFGELNEEQTEAVRGVYRASRELLDMIEATLDLTRIEARRVPLQVREVSVRNLVEDLATHATLISKPGVHLHWSVEPDLPALYTDPVKLRMVLQNLIANALKFTAEGQVRLEARADDDGVEFAVTDTGIGIPAGEQAFVFEPFRKAHGAINDYAGVGLGLYIARRLLDLLGGTVSLESELGHGSCFRVRLPRAVVTNGGHPHGDDALGDALQYDRREAPQPEIELAHAVNN
jgi:signal transduction histidine kinase